MKLAFFATVSASLVKREADRNLDGEKRYFQLTDMMEHYNSQFDERKYWAYGCNCLILGKLFQRIQEISKRFHLIPNNSI